jgi:acyl-CoA reductase-like NAD-dependent aldehyde dehydrogenase
MKTTDKFYIDGRWVAPSGSGRHEVFNSTTEEVIGVIPAGDAKDVDRAVVAARAAFEEWSGTSPAERAALLQNVQRGLAQRGAEIAETVAMEVGMPLGLSKMIQAGLPALSFGTAAQLALEYRLEETIGNSLVVKEPVGVVGAITPWNYPLHQVAAKVAPALAAGCTVVLKPSEVAPLSAFILAEIIEAAGLPAGVFNLVTGDGPTVGEAIVDHPLVDMVSFTGSTRAGKRVSELASKTVKRVALELGGKSANVILDDADLAAAVRAGVQNCYLNSGQTCSAWTRMLVPRAKHEEAARLAKKAAESFTVGNPLDGATRLGPLVSKRQQERVRGYIRKGIEEGATLVTGGPEQPAGQPRGFFVKPTVFANVLTTMTIAQEEIFGPVLCIMPYEDEEHAIRLANDTVYGLAGGVWSVDAAHAKRVALRLRTGQVDINGGSFNPMAPFGGYKQSGRGRELGKFGFEEYLEVKSLQL